MPSVVERGGGPFSAPPMPSVVGTRGLLSVASLGPTSFNLLLGLQKTKFPKRKDKDWGFGNGLQALVGKPPDTWVPPPPPPPPNKKDWNKTDLEILGLAEFLKRLYALYHFFAIFTRNGDPLHKDKVLIDDAIDELATAYTSQSPDTNDEATPVHVSTRGTNDGLNAHSSAQQTKEGKKNPELWNDLFLFLKKKEAPPAPPSGTKGSGGDTGGPPPPKEDENEKKRKAAVDAKAKELDTKADSEGYIPVAHYYMDNQQAKQHEKG